MNDAKQAFRAADRTGATDIVFSPYHCRDLEHIPAGIADLPDLWAISSLSFANTLGTERDLVLQNLSTLPDDQERTRKTLPYLGDLPVYGLGDVQQGNTEGGTRKEVENGAVDGARTRDPRRDRPVL